MKTDLQDISNAREEMQRRIMVELAETSECYLCPDVIARIAQKYPDVASLPVHESEKWFVKHNDFPYEGTKLHILIVPKKHVQKMEELTPEEFVDLQKMIGWVNTTFDITGASLFVRYGNMSYTGGTLAHLHFHVLHGVAKYEGCEAIRAKLSYK